MVSAATGEEPAMKGPVAGFHIPSLSRRFCARLIDFILCGFLLMPALGWKVLVFGFDDLALPWGLLIYVLMVPILYESLALWMFGATFGKWALGLRLVASKDDRHSSGYAACLLRVLVMQGMFFVGVALPALAWLRYDRTHLGDWMAGTRVLALGPALRPVRLHVGRALVVIFVVGAISLMNAAEKIQSLYWGKNGVVFSSAEDED